VMEANIGKLSVRGPSLRVAEFDSLVKGETARPIANRRNVKPESARIDPKSAAACGI
jgi:hypothetical protein